MAYHSHIYLSNERYNGDLHVPWNNEDVDHAKFTCIYDYYETRRYESIDDHDRGGLLDLHD